MRLTALWWWIDRWRKSSAYMDMTLEEQGAYRNLLDEAYLRGGPLPNDDRILAKACGDAMTWPRVRAVVLKRFTIEADGCWHNATLDTVHAKVSEISQKRSEAGRHGNDKRWHRKTVANVASSIANGIAKSSQKDLPSQSSIANGIAKPIAPDPDQYVRTSTVELISTNKPVRTIARARDTPEPLRHTKAPIIGKNTHLTHVFCDDTFSYCVPAAVHHKLAALLAPKHAGDQDRAAEALRAWYPTVTAKLAEGFVMGDAFRFWQARFDETFATSEPPKGRQRMTEDPATMDAGVLEILKKQGVFDQ